MKQVKKTAFSQDSVKHCLHIERKKLIISISARFRTDTPTTQESWFPTNELNPQLQVMKTCSRTHQCQCNNVKHREAFYIGEQYPTHRNPCVTYRSYKYKYSIPGE